VVGRIGAEGGPGRSLLVSSVARRLARVLCEREVDVVVVDLDVEISFGAVRGHVAGQFF
jgi:hypothetical protein